MRNAAVANNFERNRCVFNNGFVTALDDVSDKFFRAVSFDVALGLVADAPRTFDLFHDSGRVEVVNKLNARFNDFQVKTSFTSEKSAHYERQANFFRRRLQVT